MKVSDIHISSSPILKIYFCIIFCFIIIFKILSVIKVYNNFFQDFIIVLLSVVIFNTYSIFHILQTNIYGRTNGCK